MLDTLRRLQKSYVPMQVYALQFFCKTLSDNDIIKLSTRVRENLFKVSTVKNSKTVALICNKCSSTTKPWLCTLYNKHKTKTKDRQPGRQQSHQYTPVKLVVNWECFYQCNGVQLFSLISWWVCYCVWLHRVFVAFKVISNNHWRKRQFLWTFLT